MSTTKEFLIRFNQAWMTHDVDTIVDGVTEDIHFRMATDEQGIQGKDAFRAWLTEMANPDYKMTLKTERVIVSGDDAVLAGSMQMIEPDGKQRQFSFCDLYKLRDGKIASLMAYFMNHDAEAGCPNGSN